MGTIERDELLARLRKQTDEIAKGMSCSKPQMRRDKGGMPLEAASSEANEAFQKILRCVSVREQSTQRLRAKLAQAGFSEEAVEGALLRAVKVGAVDDGRYAESLVRQTLASGKGLRFALREIEDLGIDPESLDTYREHRGEGDGAERERALAVLAKHPPRARNIREAAYRKLMSKGFSSDVSASCARAWSERIEEERV